MPANISKQWLVDHKQPVISADAPIRIMQFGEGGFLRAFVDWIFKKLNDGGHFSGTVRVVQPIPQGLVEKLKQQDYVYSLVLRGMQDGKVMDEASFIDVIRDGVNPYAEWNKYLAAAAEPSLRYIVSNTTEAGIVYNKTAKPAACPDSFPAKVACLLEARYHAVKGAADWGLVFLPCELIEKNGEKLRDAVLRHLDDWGLLGTVGKWVAEHCRFYNTLVDRIVTGYPRDEAEAIWKKLDCRDELLDVGEYFLLWVIEGDKSLATEIPFQKTGLDVIVTDNLKPYRDRKVRVLNGAHTGNVLAAYLAGVDTVGEMMNDQDLGGNLRSMVMHEILPGVKLPQGDKEKYAGAVFERFQNPFVRHELLSISLNSVSKWKVRVLPSLKDYLAEKKALPPRMAFSLAGLISFYRGEFSGKDYVGKRPGGSYPIRDDQPILDFFAQAWRDHGGDKQALAKAVLANASFWDEDLSVIPGFVAKVAAGLSAIEKDGVRKALAAAV